MAHADGALGGIKRDVARHDARSKCRRAASDGRASAVNGRRNGVEADGRGRIQLRPPGRVAASRMPPDARPLGDARINESAGRRVGVSACRRVGVSACRRIGASAHRRIGASANETSKPDEIRRSKGETFAKRAGIAAASANGRPPARIAQTRASGTSTASPAIHPPAARPPAPPAAEAARYASTARCSSPRNCATSTSAPCISSDCDTHP